MKKEQLLICLSLFFSIMQHVFFMLWTKRRTDLMWQDKFKRNAVFSQTNELVRPMLRRCGYRLTTGSVWWMQIVHSLCTFTAEQVSTWTYISFHTGFVHNCWVFSVSYNLIHFWLHFYFNYFSIMCNAKQIYSCYIAVIHLRNHCVKLYERKQRKHDIKQICSKTP